MRHIIYYFFPTYYTCFVCFNQPTTLCKNWPAFPVTYVIIFCYKMSTDFSLQGSFGFDPEPVCLKHVVEKAFYSITSVFPCQYYCTIVQRSLPQYHSHYEGQAGEATKSSHKPILFRTLDSTGGKIPFTLFQSALLSTLPFHFKCIYSICPFTVVNNSSLKQIKFLQTRYHLYLKLNVTDALTYGNLAHTHRWFS